MEESRGSFGAPLGRCARTDRWLATASALVAALAPPLTTAAATGQEDAVIEEVIVTAAKRE